MPFVHINSAALVLPLLLSLLQVLGEQGGTWCFLEQVVSAAIHLPGALSSVGRARGVWPRAGAVQPASPPRAAGHEPCPGAACGAEQGQANPLMLVTMRFDGEQQFVLQSHRF